MTSSGYNKTLCISNNVYTHMNNDFDMQTFHQGCTNAILHRLRMSNLKMVYTILVAIEFETTDLDELAKFYRTISYHFRYHQDSRFFYLYHYHHIRYYHPISINVLFLLPIHILSLSLPTRILTIFNFMSTIISLRSELLV